MFLGRLVCFTSISLFMRSITFGILLALGLIGCSRKTVSLNTIEKPTGPPDWVMSSGKSARYPEAVYLQGYGSAELRSGESAEDARARATDAARTQLTERVIVSVNNETELYQENERPDELRSRTVTKSNLDLEGLQQEDYREAKSGTVHVLAYARRDNVQALYRERAQRAYAALRTLYRQGQRQESDGQPAEALKSYTRALRGFSLYDEQLRIARAVGSRLADAEPSTAELLTRDSVATRIAGIGSGPIVSLQDLAFRLALGIHRQVIGSSDSAGTVAVAPLTVEGTPLSSQLGRHLQGLIERELIRLGPLKTVTYATLSTGRVRADYVVQGSYGLTDPSTVHTTLKRSLADGRGRLIATADAAVSPSLLRSAGLALEAEGGKDARESYTQLAANQPAATGGLEFDAWTNWGREAVVATEGDTVWVYLQAAREAYVRLLYRLADGRTVLLYDNYAIKGANINRAILLPQAFVASPPFGAELMTAMAADRPFAALKTRREGEYQVVVGELEDAAMATRGLVPVQSGLTPAAPPKSPYGAWGERTIGLTTLPRR